MNSGSSWIGDPILLRDEDRLTPGRASSKGNQLKWQRDGLWYKADYTGYEGLAEYLISRLMTLSDLAPEEYVRYEPVRIQYGEHLLNGVSSRNFLPSGWQMITVERLSRSMMGEGLTARLWQIGNAEERLRFLVSSVERMTGLTEFGPYLCKVMTVDALFLNEDRHLHNLAVLMDGKGHFAYCPIFDQGAGLLADTTLDYPIGKDPLELIGKVRAKTFSRSFEEQLDCCEALYGRRIRFRFDRRDVEPLPDAAPWYSDEIRDRAREVILLQKRKYAYLFA